MEITWGNLKIYFTCVCIAFKFLEDQSYRSACFADLLNMALHDFNWIEIIVLEEFEWSLHIEILELNNVFMKL